MSNSMTGKLSGRLFFLSKCALACAIGSLSLSVVSSVLVLVFVVQHNAELAERDRVCTLRIEQVKTSLVANEKEAKALLAGIEREAAQLRSDLEFEEAKNQKTREKLAKQGWIEP